MKARRRGGGPPRERSVDLERYRSIIPDWSAFRDAAVRPEPTVFRVREGRIGEDALVERLRARGFALRALEGMPGFWQVQDEPRPVSLTPEHWHGLLYVQQASTGVAAPALGVEPGERVLDLCSAPGGKTTHIAELMKDTGSVVAAEISESRIRGLLGNVYRLGHTNIMVVAGDGRSFPDGALFDRVLVDAPCSGEGTLRRREGRAPKQSRSFRGYVTGAQRELLERAVRLTRPGGTVLYVTCTFSPEENEAVVSDALTRLPVELEALELPVPHAPGVTSFEGVRYDPRLEGAARIYPHHFDSGGLFLARLRRLDDGAQGGRGWSPVPTVFPETDSSGAPRGATDGPVERVERVEHVEHVEPHEPALRRIALGVAELRERFGVAGAERLRWIDRGGRAWLHSLDEWPLPSWSEGGWRPISVGIRAIEFDSRDRPRPTNDLLRWLGGQVRTRVVDLDDEALGDVLHRRTVETDLDDRGPIALRHEGAVIGRGAITGEGLKSEIPKSRAADLRRCLPRLDD